MPPRCGRQATDPRCPDHRLNGCIATLAQEVLHSCETKSDLDAYLEVIKSYREAIHQSPKAEDRSFEDLIFDQQRNRAAFSLSDSLADGFSRNIEWADAGPRALP
jgi:hypothetical protein